MKESSFSFEKRHFLLSKLDEIIQLWDRGFGHGSFYFAVNDGVPYLQTGLELELEDDHHLPHSQTQHHVSQPCYQGSRNAQRQEQKRTRGRGPAQQMKNRERAAAHQARLKAATVTGAAAAASVADSSSNVLKLPFSGVILPLKKKHVQDVPAPPSPPPSSSRSSPPPSSYAAAVSAPPPPVNKAGAEPINWNRRNSVTKQLFPPEQPRPCASQCPPSHPTRPPPSGHAANFKKKEDQLFQRLFS